MLPKPDNLTSYRHRRRDSEGTDTRPTSNAADTKRCAIGCAPVGACCDARRPSPNRVSRADFRRERPALEAGKPASALPGSGEDAQGDRGQ
jgi:hypothetical protein